MLTIILRTLVVLALTVTGTISIDTAAASKWTHSTSRHATHRPIHSKNTTHTTQTIYLSFHGGKQGENNIHSYTLDGQHIGTVLTGDHRTKSLRSMLLLDDSTLLVANANKKESAIFLYSQCSDSDSNQRSYQSTFASDNLVHPYGIAKNSNKLFVSSQHINTINSYDLASQNWIETVQDFQGEQIRGLAVDLTQNRLYVANKDINQVVAIDIDTNQINASASINVNDPVGVIFDANSRLLYVGSLTDNKVYAWNVDQLTLTQTYSHDSLNHPAGLAILDDKLFVVDQKESSVLQFSVSSGAFVGILIDNLPDAPEQMIISNC